YSLSHDVEYRVTKAFNPRLYFVNACITQHLQLCSSEIGLDFVRQLHSNLGLREHGQKILEVSHIKNVIYHIDLETGMPTCESRYFFNGFRRRLAAVTHASPVKPAKCTVMFGTPPASA